MKNINMDDAMQISLLIVGAGNMGKSIAQGLISKQWPANLITFCEQDKRHHDALQNEFTGCNVISHPDEMSKPPRVTLLAVKPHDMPTACKLLSNNSLFTDCFYITVAAGVPVNAYKIWLGPHSTIIRCMPNTPAAIGMGMTGLYTDSDTGDEEKSIAVHILGAIGKTIWVDKEPLLDAVTALSGSGPAYLFYLMECIQNSGQSLGLDKNVSYQLTLQTMLGAAQLAAHQDIDFKTLRANVTSKGGTTEQAINCFIKNNLHSIVEEALGAAALRAREISESFNEKE